MNPPNYCRPVGCKGVGLFQGQDFDDCNSEVMAYHPPPSDILQMQQLQAAGDVEGTMTKAQDEF